MPDKHEPDKSVAPTTGKRLTAKQAVLPNQPVLQSWPNLFGPSGDGSIPGEALSYHWDESGPDQLWETRVGTGYSSPIVVRDRILLQHRVDDQERVSCWNVQTAEPCWQFSYPTGFKCGSTYSDGPYSTPVSDGSLVFSIGAEGQLHALRVDDGELLWSHDLLAEFGAEPRTFGTGHSAALHGNRLVVNVGGPAAGVVCFDKRDGSSLWSSGSDPASFATPRIATLHGRQLVFVLTYKRALALELDTGRLLWELPLGVRIPEAENAVTPLVWRDMVLFSSYGNGSVCVRISPDGSFEKLWEGRKILTSQFNSLVCVDGFVYGFHCTDQSLRCVELETGRIAWRKKVPFRRSNVWVSGQHLLMLDEQGRLASVAVDPLACRLGSVSGPLLQAPCFSTPAFANGRMFLRNEQHVSCFQMLDQIALHPSVKF